MILFALVCPVILIPILVKSVVATIATDIHVFVWLGGIVCFGLFRVYWLDCLVITLACLLVQVQVRVLVLEIYQLNRLLFVLQEDLVSASISLSYLLILHHGLIEALQLSLEYVMILCKIRCEVANLGSTTRYRVILGDNFPSGPRVLTYLADLHLSDRGIGQLRLFVGALSDHSQVVCLIATGHKGPDSTL